MAGTRKGGGGGRTFSRRRERLNIAGERDDGHELRVEECCSKIKGNECVYDHLEGMKYV
jgi:hypothetical protein